MADSVGKLNLKLAVDGSEFGPGLQRESQNLERFASQARATSDRVGQTFQNLGNSASGVFQSFVSGGPKAAVDSLGTALSGLSVGFLALGGAAGVAVGGIIGLIQKLSEAAEKAVKELHEVNKLSRTIGESGQVSQTLRNVFANAGIEDAQTPLLRFFDKLGEMRASLDKGEGGGATGDVLRRIGLDPQAIANASPAAAFQQIVLALNNTRNAYDRAAASQAIFSRSFVDLQPIISRGGAAFAGAARQTELAGASNRTLQLAADARRMERELTEAGRQTWGEWASQSWAAFSARWEYGHQQFRREFARARGVDLTPPVAVTQVSQTFRFDEQRQAAENAARRTREATAEAEKLAERWRDSAGAIGLTSREAEILKAEQAGVSSTLLEQLRTRDRELSILERRNALEKEMRSLVANNRTAAEKFYDLQRRVNESSLEAASSTRLIGSAFLDLQKSLGSLPTSFASEGITAGSIEDAKLRADLQIRSVSQDAIGLGSIQAVLQIANQISEEQIAQLREIGSILRGLQPLGVAQE